MEAKLKKDSTNYTSARELLRRFTSQAVLHQGEIARTLGMTANEITCLNVIMSGGPMSPNEIARRTGFTTGGITKILDRLETHGAVRRRADVNDRRGLVIEPLTPRFSALQHTFPLIDFEEQTAALFEGYNLEERATIEKFLSQGAEQFQQLIDHIQHERKDQK